MVKTVGSVCSGIEAASVAWMPLELSFEWFSEIAPFPTKILAQRYPTIANHGDMSNLPDLIQNGEISTPDLICGGTPCQAFSLAGWKNGLKDERGNLTLKFSEIIEANDEARRQKELPPTVVFWENVEGVLKDRTNAFGCFVSKLAGLAEPLNVKSWPNAGLLRGPKRNVAWRILDAKHFGLPQQRRRLYLLAGGKDFYPEHVLFERHVGIVSEFPKSSLTFAKDGHQFEIFREFTDCLYSAYGTKWNGNAAAYNGSLYVVQDGRIRRFSPLECERLMGLPDDYTEIQGAKNTNRYQAIGNSWAVPVVRWIGQRLLECEFGDFILPNGQSSIINAHSSSDFEMYYGFSNGIEHLGDNLLLNCTAQPEISIYKTIQEIVESDAPESIYISPVGCHGIIRRSRERKIVMNKRLDHILLDIASQMPLDEIEKKSRVQSRGKYSAENQMSLFGK